MSIANGPHWGGLNQVEGSALQHESERVMSVRVIWKGSRGQLIQKS